MSPLAKAPFHLNLWVTKQGEGNPLRQFMAWRKLYRTQGSFAYAHMDVTLHRDLCTVDNFLFAMGEPPSDAPMHEKEMYVSKMLEKEGLSSLTKWFPLRSSHPASMTAQERTVASICFALLSQAEETLIDLGSVTLDELCMGHIRQVLIGKNNRPVIIATHKPECWKELTSQVFAPLTDVPLKKAS